MSNQFKGPKWAPTPAALSGARLMADYQALLTKADLQAIDEAALYNLRERGGTWDRQDVALSWVTATLEQFVRKGLLRPLEELQAKAKDIK